MAYANFFIELFVFCIYTYYVSEINVLEHQLDNEMPCVDPNIALLHEFVYALQAYNNEQDIFYMLAYRYQTYISQVAVEHNYLIAYSFRKVYFCRSYDVFYKKRATFDTRYVAHIQFESLIK
jgi:hypothetical protein